MFVFVSSSLTISPVKPLLNPSQCKVGSAGPTLNQLVPKTGDVNVSRGLGADLDAAPSQANQNNQV